MGTKKNPDDIRGRAGQAADQLEDYIRGIDSTVERQGYGLSEMAAGTPADREDVAAARDEMLRWSREATVARAISVTIQQVAGSEGEDPFKDISKSQIAQMLFYKGPSHAIADFATRHQDELIDAAREKSVSKGIPIAEGELTTVTFADKVKPKGADAICREAGRAEIELEEYANTVAGAVASANRRIGALHAEHGAKGEIDAAIAEKHAWQREGSATASIRETMGKIAEGSSAKAFDPVSKDEVADVLFYNGSSFTVRDFAERHEEALLTAAREKSQTGYDGPKAGYAASTASRRAASPEGVGGPGGA